MAGDREMRGKTVGFLDATTTTSPHNDERRASDVARLEQLRLVMASVQVATVRPQVGLSLFADVENGTRLAPAPIQGPSLNTMLDHLIAWSGALRPLREHSVGSVPGRANRTSAGPFTKGEEVADEQGPGCVDIRRLCFGAH
jgi:hypothetical protein